jgi:hypothetical protein
MKLELSKIIPARRKTIKFYWVQRHFTKCSEKYLTLRKEYRRDSMTSCDWCKKPFEIGEWIAIANPVSGQEGPKRNWALCQRCVDLMNIPENASIVRSEEKKDV